MSMTDKTADVDLLIAEFEQSSLRELHVRTEGFELYLSKDANAGGLDRVSNRAEAPSVTSAQAKIAPVSSAPTEAPPPAEQDWPEGAVVVRAPYLGTFYRAPKPGADPYVSQGQSVTAEDDVCLVEVMKLFTAVRAGQAGTIHAVLVADGALVAADQPLFVIIPA
jgi:acetyl-CoA carboxylase biotin carboxyl carrier protein